MAAREQFKMKFGMRIVALALSVAATGAVTTGYAVPAAAQMTDRFNFIKAVRAENAAEAAEFLTKPGSTVVNSRNPDDGKAALHIVIERRDAPWINFLKKYGADMDVRDVEGNTPLILASSLRFTDGVRLLLAYGADVNASNRKGETPLIRAVQRRDADIIRLLMKAGADPDQPDSFAGLSARDYAQRDRRASRILELIEQRGEEPETVVGPQLD